MKKYSFLQLVLTVVSVSSLMISNILTAKQILLPFGISMTCGAIVFPLTYVLSDVFSEVYGYKWSRITCYIGFAMNVLMVAFFEIAIIAKSPEWFENQDAFVSVLGSAPRILLASFLAFLLGDFVNDNVFAKMKAKHADLKGFGARAILSSFFGQITDSAIFIPIAFVGQMKAAEIMALIATEVCVKTTCEIIIYPLTRFVAKKVCDYERSCDNAER